MHALLCTYPDSFFCTANVYLACDQNGFCSQTSLLSSSTSLGETSFDSASEHTAAEMTSTHSPSHPASVSRRKIAFSPHYQPSVSKSSVSGCRCHCIDRSLPSDLHEVGRVPDSSGVINKTSSKSHYEKHRKSQHVSRQPSSAYRTPTSLSGLCYADVVNQDAVMAHRSRMQELWLENLRSVHNQHQNNLKRGSERSMSSGPMVEHTATSPTWHEKTLTTLRKPLQHALRSEDKEASVSSLRPSSAHHSQTHGRFTVTSSLESSSIKSPMCGNPSSPSWFTDTIDLDYTDVATTAEPEVSTSHSTLDLAIATPSPSLQMQSAPKPKLAKLRHFSATTPGSPTKRRSQQCSSPPQSNNTPISRRMSFGDQPLEFCPLQKKKSSLIGGSSAGGAAGSGGGGGCGGGGEKGRETVEEEPEEPMTTTVAQVYTSLDSVKPDRAQELFSQGAPVAQWLMEYFDQIEKAKWSKVESQVGDEEDVFTGSGTKESKPKGCTKTVNYKPILSAADYLKSDACALAVGGWFNFCTSLTLHI